MTAAYRNPILWQLPVSVSVQTVLIMDVRCVRCHLHSDMRRQECELIKRT